MGPFFPQRKDDRRSLFRTHLSFFVAWYPVIYEEAGTKTPERS
jgi:hypothetical protein